MASAKVSYGALKTEENNDPNGLKSASFDEEGVEVRTKPSGSRRTILQWLRWHWWERLFL